MAKILKKILFSLFFRRPWRRTASRALGYQYVLFEKYRIYDGSLEVRVGRRLTPKSGEEHAAAEGKSVEIEEPLPSRDGLEIPLRAPRFPPQQ